MDVRVGKWNMDFEGEVYYGHGPCFRGGRFPEPFEDLTVWLTEHPNELVIWEIKHAGNEEPSEDQYKVFVEMMETHLKPFAMLPGKPIKEVTLGDARNGQNLIVIYKMKNRDMMPDWCWEKNTVSAPWHDSGDWDTLKGKIEEDINGRDTDGPNLHGTQMIHTPPVSCLCLPRIVPMPLWDGNAAIARNASKWFDEFLAPHEKGTNIVMMDFVETQLDLAKKIINKNS